MNAVDPSPTVRAIPLAASRRRSQARSRAVRQRLPSTGRAGHAGEADLGFAVVGSDPARVPTRRGLVMGALVLSALVLLALAGRDAVGIDRTAVGGPDEDLGAMLSAYPTDEPFRGR